MKRKSNFTRGPLERMARVALKESSNSMRRLESACAAAVAAAAEAAITCLQNGGTLYFCGNGGSAADAQHLACELAGRYLFDRPALPAVALTTNTSSLTAIGNDYAYDQVFSRQLEGVGSRGDVLVALTTSGGSRNVLRAVRVARRLGMIVIGFTGAKGAAFAASCDFALITPSLVTPQIQEGHIAMGHALCALIERELFDPAGTGPRRMPASASRRRPAGRASRRRRSKRGSRTRGKGRS
jgi:D-sedoheptulose 7-phosphate isomerase